MVFRSTYDQLHDPPIHANDEQPRISTSTAYYVMDWDTNVKRRWQEELNTDIFVEPQISQLIEKIHGLWILWIKFETFFLETKNSVTLLNLSNAFKRSRMRHGHQNSFPQSHLEGFLENIGDISEEQRERIQQDIRTKEEQYQER